MEFWDENRDQFDPGFHRLLFNSEHSLDQLHPSANIDSPVQKQAEGTRIQKFFAAVSLRQRQFLLALDLLFHGLVQKSLLSHSSPVTFTQPFQKHQIYHEVTN
jgi:hypothetical protein